MSAAPHASTSPWERRLELSLVGTAALQAEDYCEVCRGLIQLVRGGSRLTVAWSTCRAPTGALFSGAAEFARGVVDCAAMQISVCGISPDASPSGHETWLLCRHGVQVGTEPAPENRSQSDAHAIRGQYHEHISTHQPVATRAVRTVGYRVLPGFQSEGRDLTASTTPVQLLKTPSSPGNSVVNGAEVVEKYRPIGRSRSGEAYGLLSLT